MILDEGYSIEQNKKRISIRNKKFQSNYIKNSYNLKKLQQWNQDLDKYN